MLKQLRDLTIYEAWEISMKYCTSNDNLSSEEFNEMCGKCPFYSEAERNENCPLCNNLFAYVGNLSNKDLDKIVEVEDICITTTIYSEGLEVCKIEDKDAKIRNQAEEIKNILEVNKRLNDKNLKLHFVMEEQKKIIDGLVNR